MLGLSTVEIERLRRLEARWETYGRATVVKHGVKSSLATAQIKRLQQRIRELQDEIE